MYEILKSSTQSVLVFLLVDNTDHLTGKTGLTPTVTLSKNGGSFASPSGAVSEIANGFYKVAGNATDTNTAGPLILHATGTGADPVDVVYAIVGYDPQDGVRLGLTSLPNAAAEASGGLLTRGTGAGQISLSSGTVTVGTNNDKSGYTVSTVSDKTGYALSSSGVQAIWDALTSALTTASSIGKKLSDWVLGSDSKVLLSSNAQTGVTIPTVTSLTNSVTLTNTQGVKKNTALPAFAFKMYDSAGNPKTGLTVSGFVTIDGAAYVTLTNSVTELSNGTYLVDLAAADLNGRNIMLRFTASGASDTDLEIITVQA